MLNGYRGTLMVDGYSGYDPVCAIQSLLRLGCWAHARRKFMDAKKLQPKGKTGRADQALAYIQKLYVVERKAKQSSAQQRHQLRQEQSAPIVEKLKAWLEQTTPRVTPKSTLGKALHYLNQQWPRMIRYLDDGQYPIDNNFLENAIRPFAVGRKNWLFCQSMRGASASANLYSVVETAKANGLDPCAYLKHVFTHLPQAQNVDDIAALLPGNFNTGD